MRRPARNVERVWRWVRVMMLLVIAWSYDPAVRVGAAIMTSPAGGYQVVGNLAVTTDSGGTIDLVQSILELRQQLAALQRVQNSIITSPMTLTVGMSGANFTSIGDAWDSLTGRVIAAPVTIHIADGQYSVPSRVYAHPSSAYISIVGNTNNPAAVQLTQLASVPPSPCFAFNSAASAGVSIAGFTLTAATGGQSTGISVTSGSSLRINGPIAVVGFDTGLSVSDLSYVSANPFAFTARSCTTSLSVAVGAVAGLESATLDGTNNWNTGASRGVVVGGTGTIYLQGATIRNVNAGIVCYTAANYVYASGISFVSIASGSNFLNCDSPIPQHST